MAGSPPPNENRRWPDDLAVRLNRTPGLEHVGVLNEGISGNRVLNGCWGPSAMKRFDGDVLAQSDVRYLIILESINDIGRLHDLRDPDDAVTAAQLELGLKQMAESAKEHGIKVIGATLTPYEGAGYYSSNGEQAREGSTTGFAPAEPSTLWWISTRRYVIHTTPDALIPGMTQAIICIQRMRAIKPWPQPLTSRSSRYMHTKAANSLWSTAR